MIYADYNGSAPLHPDVLRYLKARLEGPYFANPNSSHFLGKFLLDKIEEARIEVASFVDCSPFSLYFNSGSSEAITQVFFSILSEQKGLPIITSQLEHSAVKNIASYYHSLGHPLHWVKTTPQGEFDLNHLESILKNLNSSSLKQQQTSSKNKALICLMAAHNESGVIMPFEAIGKMAQENNCLYFSDTTQIIGKTNFSFKKSSLDFMCLSGHKIGAMTGIGAVIAKKATHLKELIKGGGQESGLRGGTQNYLGIETLAIAAKGLKNILAEGEQLKKCEQERDFFEEVLKEQFNNIVIIGKEAKRVPQTSFFSIPSFSGKKIQEELSKKEIYLSTSSACSDHKTQFPAIFQELNLSKEVATGVLRISSGIEHPCFKKLLSPLIETIKQSSSKTEKRPQDFLPQRDVEFD